MMASGHREHNRKQRVPVAPIVRQSQGEHFLFGRRGTAYAGCSWIAIFNLLALLGTPAHPADIIYWLERRPPFGGLVAGGRWGTYPWSVSGFLRRQGYRVRWVWRKKRVLHQSSPVAGLILLSFGSGGHGHYVAAAPRGNGVFQFYNHRQGAQRDVQRLAEFYQERPLTLTLMVWPKPAVPGD